LDAKSIGRLNFGFRIFAFSIRIPQSTIRNFGGRQLNPLWRFTVFQASGSARGHNWM